VTLGQGKRVIGEGIGRYSGTVFMGHIGGESKQGHDAPLLRLAEGWLSIFIIGDNPFESGQLTALLGQDVSVVGEWRGMTLRVAPADINARPTEEE
jgi:hypothetical protein